MEFFLVLFAAAALGFADRFSSAQRAVRILAVVVAIVALVALQESLL